MRKYSEESRESILNLSQLVRAAVTHRLNSENIATITKVGGIIRKINNTNKPMGVLFVKYKFRSNKLAGMKAELRGWVNEIKKRDIKWKRPKDGGYSDDIVIPLVAILYRAGQLHFLETHGKRNKKPRDAQLLSLLVLIDGLGGAKGRIAEICTAEKRNH